MSPINQKSLPALYGGFAKGLLPVVPVVTYSRLTESALAMKKDHEMKTDIVVFAVGYIRPNTSITRIAQSCSTWCL